MRLPRGRAATARLGLALAGTIVASFTLACPDPPADAPASERSRPESADPSQREAAPSTHREAFFGDLHVHTGWSLDAYDQGVRTGPDDAYRFARGEAIPHAAGYTIELAGPPLDFLAVTDHAEYLGVPNAALRETHVLHRQPVIQHWLGDDPGLAAQARRAIRQSAELRRPFPALVNAEVLDATWREVVEIANAHDRPGTFTTFIGFEYTSNPDYQNLHRNVLFKGDRVPPRLFSAFDSSNPEDLWRWMDRARSQGDDLIAIPHNANGSNGLMFAPTRFRGGEIDAAWAEQRLRNEPIAELFQIKGQSETTPELSPQDEWADFEVVRWQTLMPNRKSRASGSYVRDALATGLGLREARGFDPFALGFVGSTDTHNSASPVLESDYFGKLGLADGTPESRLGLDRVAGVGRPAPIYPARAWSAAGLAGLWATENTREALFDALRRRETFATSGPRIRLRLIAGFGLEPDDAHGALDGLVPAKAVAMGSELPARPGAGSPRLILAAQRDPLEAPLERLQIIKLARRAGTATEQVFDVACAGGVAPDPQRHRCPGARPATPTTDPVDCVVPAEGGASELVASWQDPDYSEREHALYYARVLQVRTCRWSRFDAMRLGRPDPAGLPVLIQERAVSSPIWLVPVPDEPRAVGSRAGSDS